MKTKLATSVSTTSLSIAVGGEVNAALRQPAVDAATGGRHGGGAVLTPVGRRIIAYYRAIEGLARSSAGKEFRAIEKLVRRAAKPRGA